MLVFFFSATGQSFMAISPYQCLVCSSDSSSGSGSSDSDTSVKKAPGKSKFVSEKKDLPILFYNSQFCMRIYQITNQNLYKNHFGLFEYSIKDAMNKDYKKVRKFFYCLKSLHILYSFGTQNKFAR